MKLEIDWTRCDGHGLCATLLAGKVALDDWGYPVIPRGEIADVDVQHARRAAAACPALALRITRG